MGEPNNALGVYMNRTDRIKSVLEYYIGERLPEDWQCEEVRGFYTVRNRKGKLSFRQRDYIGKAHAWGIYPLCLRDMMDQRQKSALPKKLRNLAGNYKVNLIHMRYIPETELEKMDSDLKYVLGIMKRSKDKKFVEYIRKNREFFSVIPKSV
ncbi:MAG: hypothetical protein HFH87_18065 [Lachnospiraceae bacterium]|nr:hypothetical protein [Lachnospiraceae bacterium]